MDTCAGRRSGEMGDGGELKNVPCFTNLLTIHEREDGGPRGGGILEICCGFYSAGYLFNPR